MELTKVCNLEAAPLPGTIKEFKINNLEILLINVDGKYYCTSARCPHSGGAPLGEGTIDGTTLICPWHEARFRVTDGQLLKGPATESLSSYKTIVKDNQIFIELDQNK